MPRFSHWCCAHIPGGESVLLTLPAGAKGVGDWSVQARLALPSPHNPSPPGVPRPAPGGQLQLLASEPRGPRPGGCGRGAAPPSQDPPESPFLPRPCWRVGGAGGARPTLEGLRRAWGLGRPGRASHSVGGAQAGSGGWAGAETLARPSSCRRNSELAGGWLPGTSRAVPWPPAPRPLGRPRLLGSGPLSRLLRTDAETSGEPWAKPQAQLRFQAPARQSPRAKFAPENHQGRPKNRVHPTSPIWGSEGKCRAALAFRGPPWGPGSPCPWLPSLRSWAAPASCSPIFQPPGESF